MASSTVSQMNRPDGLVAHVVAEQQSPSGRFIWGTGEEAIPYAGHAVSADAAGSNDRWTTARHAPSHAAKPQNHGTSRALDGLRVVDLSRILAGPWCTQNLADLGASVLKIERPGTGDDTRAWGPPFVQAPGGEAVSAYFLSCNRGKQSVALDFTEPASHAWLLRQIRDADVLVENYKAGALARHGLDYAALAAINPGLIYLSITGFGQSGPFAHKPGYDYVFQGLGGLMGYTGVADGEEGAGPLRTGVAVVDLMTGMYATSAVLAAVVQRQRTGRGQHIDLALLDVA